MFRTAFQACSLLRVVFAGILALLSMGQVAQAQGIYVEPEFYFDPLFYEDSVPASSSVDAVFSSLQTFIASESNTQFTYQAINLRPSTSALTYNGGLSAWSYDIKTCEVATGGCTTTPENDHIARNPTCPVGSYGAYSFFYPTGNDKVWYCYLSPPTIVPPPKHCKSCIGDPVYAANGELLQADTDYKSAVGLDFTRTYRSTNGSYASVINQTFFNYSLTPGTTSTSSQCYMGVYTVTNLNLTGSYCFPYISLSGLTQFQLQTNDGQMIQFTGPSTAVTQKADITERVTQATLSDGSSGWQVVRDDDSTETYNSAGLLMQTVLRGGKTFTYTYSTTSTPTSIAPWAGLLLTQSDAFGHTLSWQYNASGQMSQMTDPAGGIYQYAYDSNGNLTGVTYPDGSSKTYWYNESANTAGTNLPHALTGITDESGVRYETSQYNSAGLAVNMQRAGAVDSYAFNYTTPGSTTVVTDPLGTSRTYQFSQVLSYDQDASITQPAASGSGTVTNTISHDPNGNISLETDFNGVQTKHVYDSTRNLETSRIEAYGTPRARTITTQWNATWRQPALITEPNRTTAFTYDSLGNPLTKTITDTSVTPNVARTWTYTYDSYGRILTADGPRTDVTDVTTYAYYTCTSGFQCGQLQTVTNAAGQVTTYNTYNAHGQPLAITDPNGVLTTLTYDARQRLTSRQTASETTAFAYWPTGLLKTVTLPDGSYLAYTYDNAHRLTQITDALGNKIVYTLDTMGNRTAENSFDPSNALHRTHTRVFNALSELYNDVNAAGTAAVTTTFGYDNNGNQTSIAAPLARNTANAYDELNRLKQITDPANGLTQFGYDANDNLTAVTDPRNLATAYTYTGFGDLKTQASPDTGTTTNTYDSAGNLATSTDSRGAVSTYAYDALNRVTSVAYSLGGTTDQTIAFTYDAGTNGQGHLTGASDANHSMTWSYDALGRVTSKGQSIGTVTQSVTYGYTNADLTTLITPSGQSVTYG